MGRNDDSGLEHVLALWRSSPNDFFVRETVNVTVSQTHPLLQKLDPDVASTVCAQALERLKGYKAKNLTSLTRAIKHELKARQKRSRWFTVLIPLWVTNPPAQIRWLGNAPVLRRYKWSSVMRRWPVFKASLNRYKYHRQVCNLPRCAPNETSLFVAEARGSDEMEAFDEVAEGLWAWRALYNLVTKRAAIHFGRAHGNSIALVPPPLFACVIDRAQPTQSTTVFFYGSIARALTLENEGLQGLRNWRRRMSGTPRMYDYYTAILGAYAQGLDATSRNERYLMFWQAIEGAVLGDEINGNTKRIATRAAKLVAPSHLVGPIAQALANIRNKLVHDRYSVASRPDVIFTIQHLANNILLSAIDKALKLKTKRALSEYFRLSDKSCADLDAVKRAVGLVLRSR